MKLDLENRGAFVVGASGDIGRAIVARLLDEEARVVVGGRSAAKLGDAFASENGRLGGMVEIDLRNDASIAEAAGRATELVGGVDVLICTAAGEVNYGGVWGVERSDWEAEFGLKCVGTSRLCTAIAQGMVQRGAGVIVNVIGIATDMTVLSNPVGSAANSGLRSFTRVLAAEVAPSGVRVVGVSPGMVSGSRLDRFAGPTLEEIRTSIPLRGIAEPGEIADVVVFAASARASYLTGAIINVDGGMTLVR
jgi:NAD(P)-dependent dehydrogenase (short-subunit alcohol dehydrogenase family)